MKHLGEENTFFHAVDDAMCYGAPAEELFLAAKRLHDEFLAASGPADKAYASHLEGDNFKVDFSIEPLVINQRATGFRGLWRRMRDIHNTTEVEADTYNIFWQHAQDDSVTKMQVMQWSDGATAARASYSDSAKNHHRLFGEELTAMTQEAAGRLQESYWLSSRDRLIVSQMEKVGLLLGEEAQQVWEDMRPIITHSLDGQDIDEVGPIPRKAYHAILPDDTNECRVLYMSTRRQHMGMDPLKRDYPVQSPSLASYAVLEGDIFVPNQLDIEDPQLIVCLEQSLDDPTLVRIGYCLSYTAASGESVCTILPLAPAERHKVHQAMRYQLRIDNLREEEVQP